MLYNGNRTEYFLYSGGGSWSKAWVQAYDDAEYAERTISARLLRFFVSTFKTSEMI